MPPDHMSVMTPEPVPQSWWMVFVLACQHVVVLYSGIILVPVMVANLQGMNHGDSHYLIFATTVCAAAATLLQLVRAGWFGLGAPMFMGTSGAYLSSAHAAVALGGPSLLAGMVLVSAPFQALFSYLIRFMRHIITPTVGGVVIMLAMVGLLKDSVSTWGLAGQGEGWSAMANVLTGIATMVVMLAVEWFGGNKLRPWGVALGMGAGCLISLIDGVLILPDLSHLAWVGLPDGDWPGFQFSAGDPRHWTLTLTYVLAVLSTSIKYTGDAMLLQRVADPGRRKVDYDALQGGLYANSVGLLLAGASGGMPSSSHSANIPLMQMTGVATRQVAVLAAVLLGGLAFSPKMVGLLFAIPDAVIGGVGVVLVAHLFSSGMQLVAAEMNHRNGLIAGFSLCTGLIASGGNFFPDAFPDAMEPLVSNGVALGGLVAVVLTLVTHLGTSRGVRIAIRPTMENLPSFKAQLDQAVARFDVSGPAAGYLELACEETYMYMNEEFGNTGFEGRVIFGLRRSEDGIQVEVSGGTRLGSEADELAEKTIECPEKVSAEQLNALGLALLGRVARDISHVTIAGYTYIRFFVPDTA